jgi:hypothetical protein
MPTWRSRLLRAYRATRYVAQGTEIRIGRRSPAMDALLRRHRAQVGVLLTAWNPFSRRMPTAWNDRMQRRLTERLRRVVTLPADGAFRRWHEAHLLALSSPARMLPLARRFRQHAVVVVRVRQLARLLWLDHGRPASAGHHKRDTPGSDVQGDFDCGTHIETHRFRPLP